MHNFKVGDVVERLDDDFLHLVGPGPHVVTGVDTDGWLQVNHWRDLSGNEYPWYAKYFTLVDGGDDELPPAPESGVYYSHNNDRRVTVLLEGGLSEDVIAVGTDASFMKVRLTAETALVLAHDLRRMAMEIRRKEKQGA